MTSPSAAAASRGRPTSASVSPPSHIYLMFTVKDSGRGLEESERKLLFQRFKQATPRTHVQYGGSGLGLFISRKLTHLLGGEIAVESVAGKGSTFTFYVRAETCQPPNALFGSTSTMFAQSPDTFSSPSPGLNLQQNHHGVAGVGAMMPPPLPLTSVSSPHLMSTKGLEPAMPPIGGGSGGTGAAVDALNGGATSTKEMLLKGSRSGHDLDRIMSMSLHSPRSRPQSLSSSPSNSASSADESPPSHQRQHRFSAEHSHHPHHHHHQLHHVEHFEHPQPHRVASPQGSSAQTMSERTAAAATSMPADRTVHPDRQRPLHVLLTEDNLINQHLLQRQLQKAGCIVHVANNGQEALTQLLRSDFCPSNATADGDPSRIHLDVVLMDIEMPIMDGMTCIHHIRQYEARGEFIAHVPVIAVSANARPEQIQKVSFFLFLFSKDGKDSLNGFIHENRCSKRGWTTRSPNRSRSAISLPR